MQEDASPVALLIAAHGERRPDANNEGAMRIARAVAALDLVSAVGVGFISGVPTVKEAFVMLTAPSVIVYPLFASSGYFTRDRLVQLLDEANSEGRDVEILAPLGLDPGLPDLVLDQATRIARGNGFEPEASTIILLAHGSRRNAASRDATEQVARGIESRAVFRAVSVAFLEERPFLSDAAALVQGPAVVIGLFSGDGLHGARDAPRLIADLARDDMTYGGVVGCIAGIEDLVAGSVARALKARRRSARRGNPTP